jgi:hypothetical protein
MRPKSRAATPVTKLGNRASGKSRANSPREARHSAGCQQAALEIVFLTDVDGECDVHLRENGRMDGREIVRWERQRRLSRRFLYNLVTKELARPAFV